MDEPQTRSKLYTHERVYQGVRRKFSNLCRMPSLRFNTFQICYAFIDYFNASSTPYFYDYINYGSGRRVYNVIASHSKIRMFIHCLQMIFLFVWLVQSGYNGFANKPPGTNSTAVAYHLRDDKTHIKKYDTGVSSNLYDYLKYFWNFTEGILTYERWSPLGPHARRLNTLTFAFTANTFLQRLYCLLRFQQPWLKSRQEMQKLKNPSEFVNSGQCNHQSSFKFPDCLFETKLSLSEHIQYCFTSRPMSEQLISKYPALKGMTKKNLLEFDFVHGQVCSEKALRNMALFTFVGFHSLLSLTLWSVSVDVYLWGIDEPLQLNSWKDVTLLWLKTFELLILNFLNALTVADVYPLILMSIILSSRLSIFNYKLEKFIAECRLNNQLSDNSKSFQDRVQEYPSFDHYHTFVSRRVTLDRFKSRRSVNRQFPRRVPSKIPTNIKSKYNIKCLSFLDLLHQLLFEFKQFKNHIGARTDLDIFNTLCALTWLLSTIIIFHFNCIVCDGRFLPMVIFFSVMAIGYTLNISFQVIFPAMVSHQVSI